jgi:hypothetical protein
MPNSSENPIVSILCIVLNAGPMLYYIRKKKRSLCGGTILKD